MTWSPFFSDGHARADFDDDAGALVAEDRREQAFGIGARERELVGVADAGRLDLDQHFAGLRAFEVDVVRSRAALPARRRRRRGLSWFDSLFDLSLQCAAERQAGTCPSAFDPSHRLVELGLQHTRCFRDMGRDRVHQRRRQAIIGLELEFLQPRADRAHVVGFACPASMTEDTNAAKVGADQPFSFDSSVWMKSKP